MATPETSRNQWPFQEPQFHVATIYIYIYTDLFSLFSSLCQRRSSHNGSKYGTNVPPFWDPEKFPLAKRCVGMSPQLPLPRTVAPARKRWSAARPRPQPSSRATWNWGRRPLRLVRRRNPRVVATTRIHVCTCLYIYIYTNVYVNQCICMYLNN